VEVQTFRDAAEVNRIKVKKMLSNHGQVSKVVEKEERNGIRRTVKLQHIEL